MTPTEVWNECRKLEAEVGPKAEVSAFVSRFRKGVYVTVQPLPWPARHAVSTEGHEDWLEAFSDARAKWSEHADLHHANTIRDLSLAIVRITYDQGECSEAALRAEFDAATVARYGAQAVERANAMAEGAPFSIVPTAGANDVAEAA